MSQKVEVEFAGKSNIDEVTKKAASSMSNMEKNFEGINKKFQSFGKDLFLSVLGPMALLNTALSFIGKIISDNQKKHDDANQAAINNTNALMSAEDNYWANKKNNEKKAAADSEAAKIQRIRTTEEFLATDAADDIVSGGMKKRGVALESSYIRGVMALDPEVQNEVQGRIAKEAAAAGLVTKEARGTEFKAPQGFSNVVGVGANPVLDAMTMQLDEARKQTSLLEAIARPAGGGVPVDYTKSTSSSPSRAAMLSGK